MPQLIDVEGIGIQEFPDEATQEQIAEALNKAYPRKAPGALEAAGIGAAQSIAPSAGFAAVAPPLAAIGAEAGGAIGGPVGAAIGGIALPLVGGGLTAGLIAKGQGALLKKYLPEKAYQRIIAAEQAHPTATTLGGIAGGFPSMEAQIPKLATIPFRAALGGAIGAVQPLIEGRKPTGQDILGGTLAATVYGRSRFEKTPSIPQVIKETAPVLPKAAQALAATVGEAAKSDYMDKLRAEREAAPKTKGVIPDASSIQKATEVHGDVRPLEKPASQVPVQESGAGVQPQAPQVAQEGQARVLPVEPTPSAPSSTKAPIPSTEAPPATTEAPPEPRPPRPGDRNLKKGVAMFNAETEAMGGEEDILAWIAKTGGMMSKSEAKRKFPNFKDISGHWDGAFRVLPHTGAAIYGGVRTPDIIARQAAEEGFLKGVDPQKAIAKDLWPVMEAATKTRRNVFRRARREGKWIAEDAAEAEKISKENQAHLEAESEALPENIKLKEPSEGEPWARDIATIERPATEDELGTIVINPKVFDYWMNRIPEKYKRQAVRSLLNEEWWHLRVDDETAIKYWKSLHPIQQLIAIRRYAGKGQWSLESARMDPVGAGHEALRYKLQQLNRMTPRELAEAVGREKWTIQMLDAADAAIQHLRETFGTQASQEQLAILGRMAKNAGIARGILSRQQPGANLKESELYLGNVEEAKKKLSRKVSAAGRKPKIAEPKSQEEMSLLPPPKGDALERGGFAVPKATQVEALADWHMARAFDRAQAPSFKDFQNQLKREFGSGIKSEQVYYAWQDALNKKLMGASAAEVEKLVDAIGLRRDIAKALKPGEADPKIGAHPFADPPVEATPRTANEILAARKLAKKPLDQRLKARYAALAAIKDKLSQEAGAKPEKPWSRSEIGPEDVDQKYVVHEAVADPTKIEESPWDVRTDRQFNTLSAEERSNPAKVAELATKGASVEASGKGAPPRTVTRNVVALKDRLTGRIIMVSAWKDPRFGPKVTNPLSASQPGMKIDSELLKKFEPMAVIGLREPVKDFRQVFENQEAFDKHWGDLAIPGTPGIKTGLFAGPQAGTIETQAGIRGAGSPPPAEAGLPPELTAPTAPVGEGISAPREIIARERPHPIQKGSMLYRIPRPSPEPAEKLPPEAQAALGRAGEAAPTEIPHPSTREVLTGLGRPTGRITTFGKPAPMGPGWTLRAGLEPRMSRRAPAARLKDDIAEVGEDIAFGFHSVVDGLKMMVKKGDIDRLLPATADQMDNNAHNAANAIEHAVRLKAADAVNKRGDPEILAGANAMVESGGQLGKIQEFKQAVLAGMTKAQAMVQSPNWRERRIGKAWVRNQELLLKELSYAEQHWQDPKLRETAFAMKTALKEIVDLETAAGIDVKKEPNYLPHRWDATLWNGQSVAFQRVKIQGQRYREARTFPDHYTASANGPYIAATRDGASMVSHRYRQGLHRLYQDAWLESLTTTDMPDGKPVGLEAKMVKKGKNWRYDAPPSGYEPVHVGRSVIYIHEGAASLVRNLTARSQVQDWALTRNALHLAQVLKHSMLVGDFFHMGRVLYYGASLMGRRLGYRGGLSALDYRPQDLPEAVRKGVIRPEDAKWAQELVDFDGKAVTRQELLGKFTGANIGKIQDALYKDLLTNLSPVAGKVHRITQRMVDPSVGRFNRFLFDKLTRGIMAESLVNQYEALHKAHPQIPSQALANDIARDINNFFGNLGRQGALKSATMRDVARLFMLAPQWVEGLARKEASFMGRASGLSKGLDYMGIGARQKMPWLGATGKGVGTGLLFMFGLTQAINLINRRQFTWQNEEKEHKFDAYLKSFGGDKEGFWLSPMAIWNELAHDLYRFSFSKPTFADAVDQIAANKESPVFRALAIAATGRTGAGLQTTTTGGRLVEAGKAMVPVPITFGRYGQALGHLAAPGLVSPVPPGQLERQTFGSMGVKVEPQSSAVSEIGRMARDWMKKEGIDKSTGWKQVETDEPSYGKLRMALRNDDEKTAKKMLAGLRGNHSDQAIQKAMTTWAKKGFTTKHDEGAFIDSLSPKQQEMYWQAMDSKQEMLDKFYEFLDRN